MPDGTFGLQGGFCRTIELIDLCGLRRKRVDPYATIVHHCRPPSPVGSRRCRRRHDLEPLSIALDHFMCTPSSMQIQACYASARMVRTAPFWQFTADDLNTSFSLIGPQGVALLSQVATSVPEQVSPRSGVPGSRVPIAGARSAVRERGESARFLAFCATGPRAGGQSAAGCARNLETRSRLGLVFARNIRCRTTPRARAAGSSGRGTPDPSHTRHSHP